MTKHAHRQAKYAKKHLTPSGMPPLRTKRIYVDVENDFGTSNLATLERDELYAGGRELLEDAGFSYGDQVHVAASHYNVVAALGSRRCRSRTGRRGRAGSRAFGEDQRGRHRIRR